MPLFAIAIPVLHSSGAWIASTAASSYIAGTLSSTWIGALVLGNSTLLGSLGLVSAAGIFGASGGIAALSSSAALGIGSALTTVGLGGVANALGLARAAPLFLGLTLVGWAIAGTAVTLVATLCCCFFARRKMRRLNEEREKGGLKPISFAQIVKEVRLLEAESFEAILERLAKEVDNMLLSGDQKEVTIDGQIFSIKRLKYMTNKDGSEEIVFVTRTGRRKSILLIKPASTPSETPVVAFPAFGGIRYAEPFGTLATIHGSGKDIDLIAKDFRNWCATKKIPLDGLKIAKQFETFCKGVSL